MATPTPPSGQGSQGFAAVGVLREAILEGRLEPGEMTTQIALAERFGVGRTPVREALRLLQSEGLVVGEPNRRVQVTPLSGDDLEELYIMRIVLEPAAVRLTVPGLTSRDVAEMEGYMAQMDHYGRGRDWKGLRTPHREFHRTLIAVAGPRIVAHLSTLFDHAERYRASHAVTEEAWKARQVEHRAILDAAAARDADRAAELLIAHYVHTVRLILDAFGIDHEPVRLRTTLRRIAPDAERLLEAGATG
jgi:DNA-binding GntR family transcriptional regulator